MGGLLAALFALLVLGGVTRAYVVNGGGTGNYLNGGGCSRCDLGKMVKDCPLDVMFMLDMSDSVSTLDYERARLYVAKQIRTVTEAFQDTHVGFIAFSNIVYDDIPIRPRTDIELQQLITEVESQQQQRYGTQLADALQRARQNLNDYTGTALVPGGRRGKLIVLVSDGCQDNDRAVRTVATEAAAENIFIISVHLSDAYLDLLKAISLQVLDLRTDIDWSRVVACPAKFLPPVDNLLGCNDFVIAMDGSDSVRRWEKVMRDYLAYTAIRFATSDNAMGVVVFGTNVDTQSPDTMIQPSRDKLQLAQQIENTLSFPNERGTGTTQAIRKAAEYLRDLGSRATIVVITDGPALNPSNARQALANAMREGFEVIVIGVGDTVSLPELETLAGPGSTVHLVDSYLALYALDLSTDLCPGGIGGRRHCTPPQIFNPRTNCCECPNRCNDPRNLNNTTCLCEIPCRPPKIFNPRTNWCECPNRCNDPRNLNTDTCLCENPIPCSPPKIFNPSTNWCETPITCRRPQFYNPLTKRCECNLQCRGPFSPNTRTCECDCNLQCEPPLVLDTNICKCDCLEIQCPPGERFNRDNCYCDKICPNLVNCPGISVLNPTTCRCECPEPCFVPGEVQDPVTCVCGRVPSERPPSTCSAINNRCQNNQPGIQDCQGRCLCQCDRSLYAGFYCDLLVRPSMCDNCTLQNGDYLAPVEGRCDLYVVCQPLDNGGYLPRVMNCPPGTIFKQSGRLGHNLCDHPDSPGTCLGDPCETLPPFGKYPDSQHCARYWQCDSNRKTSSSLCCPAGEGFDSALGDCVPDSNCPNDCAGDPNFRPCNPTAGPPSCPYKAVPGDNHKFFNPDVTGPSQSCAPTDFFDEIACRCKPDTSVGCIPYYDYDFDNLETSVSEFKKVDIRSGANIGATGNVGVFSGESRIILYRFSDSGYYMDYLEISFRVWLDNVNLGFGQEMALVSNGDCGAEETLAITVDQQTVYFKVKATGGALVTVVEMPYTPDANGAISIKFQYERQGQSPFYQMTCTVNGRPQSEQVFGTIAQTKCALQMGHGQNTLNLTGSVDDFKVWTCKPFIPIVGSSGGTGPWYGGAIPGNGNGGTTWNNGGNTHYGGSHTYG